MIPRPSSVWYFRYIQVIRDENFQDMSSTNNLGDILIFWFKYWSHEIGEKYIQHNITQIVVGVKNGYPYPLGTILGNQIYIQVWNRKIIYPIGVV